METAIIYCIAIVFNTTVMIYRTSFSIVGLPAELIRDSSTAHKIYPFEQFFHLAMCLEGSCSQSQEGVLLPIVSRYAAEVRCGEEDEFILVKHRSIDERAGGRVMVEADWLFRRSLIYCGPGSSSSPGPQQMIRKEIDVIKRPFADSPCPTSLIIPRRSRALMVFWNAHST